MEFHAGDMIRLENEYLQIELDVKSGRFVRIFNKKQNLHLIQTPPKNTPWRLELSGIEDWKGVGENLQFSQPRTELGERVDITWQLDHDIAVSMRVELPAGSDKAYLFIRVINEGSQAIDKIEAPIWGGISNLSGDEDNYFVHSQGSGFLYKNPDALFEYHPIEAGVPDPRSGLRYSPYPEGYQGATMQFMAYYTSTGGFYFATHDSTQAMKWFNFFKAEQEDLQISFMHQFPDIQPGNSWELPYPIVLGALFKGDWYEPADCYKQWSLQQPWTTLGPLHARPDRSKWLLEEVGFVTFGVNASCDRSAWLERFHQIIDQPVFHILGVNWPKSGGDYNFFLPGGRNNLPGGKDDWFPARFNQKNLDTIRQNGDYWAPFELDVLFSDQRADAEEIRKNTLIWPNRFYAFDDYPSFYVCPATEYMHDLHAWRDEYLAKKYEVDGLYYDFTVANLLMTCRSPSHAHPVGGGSWMMSSVQNMYRRSKISASSARGRYVPQGTECVHELLISHLDYYQARAEACPLSPMEADFFRDWIKNGQVEKIPLFAYVYHEYGPIRVDGWGQLSREIGDLFYWVAGRVTLWGGIFELNYEFTPLENLPGYEQDLGEHYTNIQPNFFDLDAEKAAFLKKMAFFRTKIANQYLAYGIMQRPLEFQTELIDLDYYHYNGKPEWDHIIEKGSHQVIEILHAAWKYKDEKLGYCFLNLNATESKTVPLNINLEDYGWREEDISSLLVRAVGTEQDVSEIGLSGKIDLILPPREFVLLEIYR
jgi:hypothetical protein